MRAVIYRRFGPPDVVEVDTLPAPSPDGRHVLVDVRAAALNPKDVLVRKGRMRWAGARKLPGTPGYDLAGVVAPGGGAGDFVEGQAVFGMVNGMNGRTCAERVRVDVDELAPLPAGLSFPEAASLPLVGQTALQALRDCLRVEAGQHVVVHGASGGVGTVAVQIAKALGADVTAVCSAVNAELVRGLGADHVVDYRAEDVTAGPPRFHAFFDVFGNQRPARARRALLAGGRFCTTVPRAGSLLDEGLARLGLPRPRLVIVRSRRRDLEQLAAWVAEGRLRPIVDRVLPLEQCAEAMAYLETRRARGKVVLSLLDDAG